MPVPPPPAGLVRAWADAAYRCSVHTACADAAYRCGSVGPALLSFLSTHVRNQHRNRAKLSELLWSALGMFASWYLLGWCSGQVKQWPGVGAWHTQVGGRGGGEGGEEGRRGFVCVIGLGGRGGGGHPISCSYVCCKQCIYCTHLLGLGFRIQTILFLFLYLRR